MRSLLTATAAAAALDIIPGAAGHSWIQQLRSINDQGKYVGDYGYPRGMIAKGDPGYADAEVNFQIPANEFETVFINDTMLLCKESQRKAEQSQDKYPRLKAAPGKFIAMRYTENGHVTLPTNQVGKPEKGGTIFVYGTTNPKEDEKLVDVLQWTKDGHGGDKRGVLLGTNNFDDGRCYEDNGSQEKLQRQKATPNFAMGQVSDNAPGNFPLACETDVALPKDAPTGKPYTLYWVWQWPTAPGKDPTYPKGKDEYYTTCMDVDVVDTFSQGSADAKFAIPQQDAMSVAVSDWASRKAITTDAVKGEVGPALSGGQSKTGAPSATGTSPAATTPAATTPAATAPASQTTLATAPSGGSSAADGIPNMTQRPGRPQPSSSANNPGASNGNGNGLVTVTETAFITVTAPAVTARVTPRGEHVARHKRGAFKRRLAQD